MTASASIKTLRLDGELTIYRAEELKPLLLDSLRSAEVLEVDLSGVCELDTAGVQLLMLAKRTAESEGRTLRLARHSPAVLDVFELFDLAGHFGDALVIAPATA